MDTSEVPIKNPNAKLAFKCLHYSVTESAGTVGVIITKKNRNEEISFGIRTIKDTAVPEEDYISVDQKVTMAADEVETKIEIQIIDDNEWEPDMDFLVELYDLEGKDRLEGDDTQTRVTILDEDFPGTLSFN